MSRLGSQGDFLVLWVFSSGELLTQYRFQKEFMRDLNKYIFASRVFTAVVAAPDHLCHKHHKLAFWYVWFAVLGETWSCLHTQTGVSSGDH